MRVCVAGATGTLGRPTVHGLLAAGHEVRALVRASSVPVARALGAEAVAVDLFDARAVTSAVAGSEAVLHLATRIPPFAHMWRRAAWRENDRLRNQGASILVNAALECRARVYVQASVALLYRDLGSEWIYETAPLDPVWPLASARDAEREAGRFTARGGQGVVLRFGRFYSADDPATRSAVRLARFRLFPVLGSGEQYASAVHVDDAAAAVVAAVTVPAGIYNVCDDEPLPLRDHLAALTSAFGFPRAPRLPLALARPLIGPAASALARSQRVANTMFKAVSGWIPEHPSVRTGWQAVAAALRS